MHYQLKSSFALLAAFVAVATAKADPSELTTTTLTRTVESGMSLQAVLQKNMTRTEAYQAEYDVQVPYQDTETYTDYETVYEREYQCEDYTDWERECHNERQCSYSAKVDIQVPWAGSMGDGPSVGVGGGGGGGGFGGGGTIGGPAPSPAPSQPPPGGGTIGGGGGGGGGWSPPPPRQPDCYDRQVCESVPVRRQRCGYESVPHQRPVTRTRTVTRYRTETRCCVTKTHEVFDHQWTTPVSIQFPAGTELQAGESETFKLELLGSEAAPDVRLTPTSTIFGYQVASKQVNGKSILITLNQVPRFKAGDLGAATLQNVVVVPTAAGMAFSFLDNALYPRTSSRYQVTVAEAATHQQVASSEVIVAQQRQLSASLAFAWDASKLYEVVINVHREGAVIDAGVVDFQITKILSLTVDQAALKSDKNITNVGIVGSGEQAVLSFTDMTLPYADVKTDYVITLVRNGASLGAKTFARTALAAAVDGSASISLKEFALKPAALSAIKTGANLKVVIEVRRTQSGRSRIQFWKDSPIVVR